VRSCNKLVDVDADGALASRGLNNSIIIVWCFTPEKQPFALVSQTHTTMLDPEQVQTVITGKLAALEQLYCSNAPACRGVNAVDSKGVLAGTRL
jgi:hypothetical protein